MTAPIVLIHLRQPRDPSDPRDDPFWEFGSFGCTGCHRALVSSGRLDGVRLGFAQGGPDAHRLVFLTPPVRTVVGTYGAMVVWQPAAMPFKFAQAPVIVDRQGDTDFPLLFPEFEPVNRSTWLGKFSSAFRSRSRPLTREQAAQVTDVYERTRTLAGPEELATHYSQAIAPVPMDRRYDRMERYQAKLTQAGLDTTPIGSSLHL